MGGRLSPDTRFRRLGVRMTPQVLRTAGEEAPDVPTGRIRSGTIWVPGKVINSAIGSVACSRRAR